MSPPTQGAALGALTSRQRAERGEADPALLLIILGALGAVGLAGGVLALVDGMVSHG